MYKLRQQRIIRGRKIKREFSLSVLYKKLLYGFELSDKTVNPAADIVGGNISLKNLFMHLKPMTFFDMLSKYFIILIKDLKGTKQGRKTEHKTRNSLDMKN